MRPIGWNYYHTEAEASTVTTHSSAYVNYMEFVRVKFVYGWRTSTAGIMYTGDGHTARTHTHGVMQWAQRACISLPQNWTLYTSNSQTYTDSWSGLPSFVVGQWKRHSCGSSAWHPMMRYVCLCVCVDGHAICGNCTFVQYALGIRTRRKLQNGHMHQAWMWLSLGPSTDIAHRSVIWFFGRPPQHALCWATAVESNLTIYCSDGQITGHANFDNFDKSFASPLEPRTVVGSASTAGDFLMHWCVEAAQHFMATKFSIRSVCNMSVFLFLIWRRENTFAIFEYITKGKIK